LPLGRRRLIFRGAVFIGAAVRKFENLGDGKNG